jgi:hypothetical protein
MSMKNSHDTIGNRNHDLPACSAVLEEKRPLGNTDLNLFKMYGSYGVEKSGKTVMNFDYVRTSHISYSGTAIKFMRYSTVSHVDSFIPIASVSFINRSATT